MLIVSCIVWRVSVYVRRKGATTNHVHVVHGVVVDVCRRCSNVVVVVARVTRSANTHALNIHHRHCLSVRPSVTCRTSHMSLTADCIITRVAAHAHRSSCPTDFRSCQRGYECRSAVSISRVDLVTTRPVIDLHTAKYFHYTRHTARVDHPYIKTLRCSVCQRRHLNVDELVFSNVHQVSSLNIPPHLKPVPFPTVYPAKCLCSKTQWPGSEWSKVPCNSKQLLKSRNTMTLASFCSLMKIFYNDNTNKSSAIAEMGDRGHNKHGPKRKGGCCAPFAGSWDPV